MSDGKVTGDLGGFSDLRRALEFRKIWFHECHVRELNFESLRSPGDQREKLTGYYTGPDGKPLDGLPIWSQEEIDQRDKFSTEFIGKTADWLGYKQPKQLLAKLAQAQQDYISNLNTAEPPTGLPDYAPQDKDGVMRRVSRLELTDWKPWLLQKLFEAKPSDFCHWELNEMVDLYPDLAKLVDQQLVDKFAWAEAAALRPLTRGPKAATVTFLDSTKKFQIGIKTRSAYPDISKYDKSDKAWAWIQTFQNSLREFYFMKENSDMGLTHLVRILYLYGTLPPHIAPTQFPARRRRFNNAQLDLLGKAGLSDEDLGTLAGAFHANTQTPGNCDFRFSLIAEEVIKQTLLRGKYWLDEEFVVPNQDGLNAARAANQIDQKVEMQYWSENHYIMFASSEYLVGQFWPDETFQPGVDFLPPKSDLGRMQGKDRRERGKWRVLKWLNNRLTFGWTEWTTGGYYREHFWPLLNLVDFSMDPEVQTKAAMVMDLLLFDIARFSFRGANGAAGGRVQFKWKRSGWDQAIGDLVEIAFGTRGAFNDGNSEIGVFAATAGYEIPEVLLQIGSKPPDAALVDRSRVSITFEDAARYGIGYSHTDPHRTSREHGYQERLARYSPHIDAVNQAIAKTHRNYGQREEDTVFWWTTSAYFTKQIIDDSFAMAKRWGLQKADPFSSITMVFGDVWSAPEDLGLATVGFAVGSSAGAAISSGLAGPAGLAGAALGVGLFGKAPTVNSLSMMGKVALYGLSAALGPVGIVLAIKELGDPWSSEQQADDLSVMVEGSVRTRGNIYTYRSRDVMLSSVQNFRGGQVNFQNDVNRATLSGALSTFTTAPYVGIRISDLLSAALGGLMLGPVEAGLAAGATELFINRSSEDISKIAKHDDGPGWWTGYWSLPRVIQYRNVAVLFYNFPWMQVQLSDHDTHLFLPESGLTEFHEADPNSDNFDDTDSILEDITSIFSKSGIWLFGRVAHDDTQPPNPDAECYIGVFSDSRWEKKDKDSRFYKDQIKEKLGKDQSVLQDYFKDRDRYADGDNIWIIQVGTKTEYGSFQSFQDKLVNTRIKIDVDDMTCNYDLPNGDGSVTSLSFNAEDGTFQVEGQDFAVDRYPRFENTLVRGGMVEWGQRDYTIEYNQSSLTHGFRDYQWPIRLESAPFGGRSLKALAFYLRTENENMDIYTVCRGTFTARCEKVVEDEILAVGEISENTDHDVEWMYLDSPLELSSDMGIELTHPAANGRHNPEPHWRMTLRIRALMDDHTFKDCTIPLDRSPIAAVTGQDQVADYGAAKVFRNRLQLNFEGSNRSSGFLPFTIARNAWQDWRIADDSVPDGSFDRAPQERSSYYDHSMFIVLDPHGSAMLRSVSTCPRANTSWERVGSEATFPAKSVLLAVEPLPNQIVAFSFDGASVKFISRTPNETWAGKSWQPLDTKTGSIFSGFRPIPVDSNSVLKIDTSRYTSERVLVLYLAAKGVLYSLGWSEAGSPGIWSELPIATGMASTEPLNFVPITGAVVLVDGFGSIWGGAVTPQPDGSEAFVWNRIGPTDAFQVAPDAPLAGTDVDIVLRKVFVISTAGEVWCGDYIPQSGQAEWTRIGAGSDFHTSPSFPIRFATSAFQTIQVAVSTPEGQIAVAWWTPSAGWEKDHDWTLVTPALGDTPQRFWFASRMDGQVELYAATADGRLYWNWWS